MNWKIFAMRIIVFGFMLNCTIAQTTATTASNNCSRQDSLSKSPAKCSRLENLEYMYFTHEKVNYFHARNHCRDLNADLVIIRNKAIQDHIVENMPMKLSCSKKVFYYIGLYRDSSGQFVWNDGSSLNYSNWRTLNDSKPCNDEPNGYKNCTSQPGDANATQISGCKTERFNVGDWFDKDQTKSMWYYICQREYQKEEKTLQQTTTMFTTALTTSMSTQPATMTTAKLTVTTTPETTTPAATTGATTKKSTTTLRATKPTQSTTTTSHQTTAVPERLSTDMLNLKFCLEQLLRSFSEEWIQRCKLYDLFGSKFSIADWENRISFVFGDILLHSTNVSKNVTVDLFPGITIILRRLESQEDAQSELIQFQNHLQNSFNLDNEALSGGLKRSADGKLAIVTAGIDSSLWQSSGLSLISPAGPISRDFDENTLDPNRIVQFLPSNQNVLSFSLFTPSIVKNQDRAVKKLSVPIKSSFEFEVSQEETDEIYILDSSSRQSRIALDGIVYECVFLDENATKWNKRGCHFEERNDGVIQCACNHTTTFGILLAVRSFVIPKAITTLTIALELLSVVALLITVVLLTWLKKSMHNDRTIVQINLAVSLLLLHLFIVISDYVQDHSESGFCQASAVLIQFFTLTTVFWMLNEGIVLYFKTYKNALSFNLRKIFPRLAAIAWGFPLVYVTICASAALPLNKYLDISTSRREMLHHNTTSNASDYFRACYVGFKTGMIYSVIVPLVLIFAVTATIVVKTSIKINALSAELVKMRPSGKTANYSESTEKHSSKVKARYNDMNARRKMLRQASNTLRALILLLPVLGITWLLGFLVNIPKAEVYFLVVFVVINGLQGVFIFYIYCVKNSHFRRVFSRKWKEMSTNLIGSDIYHSSNNNRMSVAASQQSKSRF